MPRKKRFIDKKNAVTYHLIHRSQRDPLQADQDAPQRVLVTTDELAQAKRKEKLATYGIYYDDDYDYEQHLRDVSDLHKVEPDREVDTVRVGVAAKTNLRLPVEVLPSEKEENIGMLELAAPVTGPRLDWDPDVLAALDSDNEESMDEDLEDDFITLANHGETEEDETDVITKQLDDRQKQWIAEHMMAGRDADMPSLESDEEMENDSDWEDVEDDDSDNEDGSHDADDGESDDIDDNDELHSLQSFDEDETKTKFTNYSMSSSVIRRNQGLQLVDEKFEQLYAEYDDDELGALDHEEIDGKVSTTGPMMEFLLQQFEKQQIKLTLPKDSEPKSLARLQPESDETDDSEADELTKVVVEEGHKWDCESILSTYSNIYNHPKIIEEPTKKKLSKIELTKKLGIPKESFEQTGLTKKQLDALDKMTIGTKTCPQRSKGETAEERKARKAAVKQERKDRRAEKKNTKIAFKQEEAQQRQQRMQAQVNLQGNKLYT